ncbi:MAG: hypothetical protein HY694_04580 [Deltaproteobacteria bacterium]|nr:hypothetical protein [Deltaproteobacteria bacterium]
MNRKQRRGVTAGMEFVDCFVSKNDLQAVIPPEAIAKAGTYIVALKSEGEALPESYRARLVVALSRSEVPHRGRRIGLWQINRDSRIVEV